MDLEFNKNEDHMRGLLSQLRQLSEQIQLGGGKKAIEKQHERNKKTARERLEYLLDKNCPFVEIGTYAGHGMYAEHGGCPAGGTVAGIGYVSGRQCVVVANDQTVKAGAWFPITGKKNLRMQEIALENRLPIIYLVDSAGVYLPLQDQIFADKEHFGRVFRNNAKMSAAGIPQIAAVMGACVAGGAYLPVMSDEMLMVEGSGSVFLAGSYLVKAAIGEEVDNESLGGAKMHADISGTADATFSTEEACLDHIKKLIRLLADGPTAGFNKIQPKAPKLNSEQLYGLFPRDGKPYEMLDLIQCLVDEDSYQPFKPTYGKSICCGYARIEGWAVGIVANQRKIVKSGKGEMQMGGVIYNDSADKAARFILNCNQKRIPLIFLQDVTGFMVGSRSEQAGIIKDGAKLVNAVANSIVPKFTVVVGNSYGAGNYAMCGKAYDPRLIVAWPTAKIAVMGGEAAAKTLLQIEMAAQKAKGKLVDEQTEKDLLASIMLNYQEQLNPLYAAARLWVDEIIDPANTRTLLAQGIAAANHAPLPTSLQNGVFQV
ncbi:MAG: acyl-CoA carboxylase subunit beta [Bacteroidetes bacterium]|nr:acyl-CoA carboxylase subunit beta [Bacteroidota bacterium]